MRNKTAFVEAAIRALQRAEMHLETVTATGPHSYDPEAVKAIVDDLRALQARSTDYLNRRRRWAHETFGKGRPPTHKSGRVLGENDKAAGLGASAQNVIDIAI